jgi:hypothetical protein
MKKSSRCSFCYKRGFFFNKVELFQDEDNFFHPKCYLKFQERKIIHAKLDRKMDESIQKDRKRLSSAKFFHDVFLDKDFVKITIFWNLERKRHFISSFLPSIPEDYLKIKRNSIELRSSVIKGEDSGYRLNSPNFDFSDGILKGYGFTIFLENDEEFLKQQIVSTFNKEFTNSMISSSNPITITVSNRRPTPAESIHILNKIMNNLCRSLTVTADVFVE